MVHVRIDGGAIIAARAALALSTTCSGASCEAQLVEVGVVQRSTFLDNGRSSPKVHGCEKKEH